MGASFQAAKSTVALGGVMLTGARALVGLRTMIGEFAYDTSRSVLETITRQWGTFDNSMNSAIMQSR